MAKRNPYKGLPYDQLQQEFNVISHQIEHFPDKHLLGPLYEEREQIRKAARRAKIKAKQRMSAAEMVGEREKAGNKNRVLSDE